MNELVKAGPADYNGLIMESRLQVMGLGGQKTLRGNISVSGAKNSALKALAASILFDDELKIENLPAIEDVGTMRTLMSGVGVASKDTGDHACTIDASQVTAGPLDVPLSEKIRASIVLTGPLLARTGSVTFPHPGGDVIGARPIDLFLEGFEKMGAFAKSDGSLYTLSAPKGLVGADIFFRVISVTATETLMMAATLARGTTILRNVAREPEIPHLAEFLNRCGAAITGAGTSTITIKGGNRLRANGTSFTVLPDRIEAGSFAILGSLLADELSITNCVPEHLAILIEMLRFSGVPIESRGDTITITANAQKKVADCKPLNIRTHEYPGFATDLQAPMTVFLTQVKGESTVFETIFEGRLNYTQDLVRMGADITMGNPHQIVVRGPSKLSGKELHGPDIRAGLAYVLAALVAEGDSVINNVHHIDRGYEHVERKLQGIGASITRM